MFIDINWNKNRYQLYKLETTGRHMVGHGACLLVRETPFGRETVTQYVIDPIWIKDAHDILDAVVAGTINLTS